MSVYFALLNFGANAVHWLFFLVPMAIIYGLYFFTGPIPTAVIVSCATLNAYFTILFPGDKTEKIRPILKKVNKPFVKKSVLVIGAGPAGVTASKECAEAGHDVTCYDSSNRLGGTFANFFWPGGHLTSSPYVTAFSDFEPARNKNGEERKTHHSAEEYVTYLNDYVKHYGVADCINLKHKVLHVKENDEGKIMADVQNLETGVTTVEGPFDHMVVSSGAFHTALTPKFKGIETFPGKLVHSRDFAGDYKRTADEAFAVCSGKRVVSIGLGESMADILGIITTKISKPTTYAACAVRKGCLIIPRIHPQTGVVTDLLTSRLRHALPKPIRNMVINMHFRTHKRHNKAAIARFDLMTKIPGKGVTYVKTCKSGMMLPAIQQDKLVIKPALDRIEGKTIYFADGSKSEDIDVIIYGTGYDIPKFSYIDENSFKTSTGEKMMDPHSNPVDRLFRMIDPKLGDKVAYLGLGIRPLVGSIPSSAEMQARVLAMIISGKRDLPSKGAMEERIMKLKEFSRKESAAFIEQWFLYVNWIPFMDMLSREIGSIPRSYWLFTQPRLYWKLLLSPVTTFHYRLHGHGAKKIAKDVVHRLPYVTSFKDLWFFASVNFTLSLFRWPRDTLEAIAYNLGSLMPKSKMD